MDGSLAEWDGRLTPLDNTPVSMAALSTDSLLYVAVLIRDRALIRTIAQHGLILWVDPTGGTNHTYGVQYPLGLRRQHAGRSGSRTALDDIDAVSLEELEVLRGDTLRTRIPSRFSSGLRGDATLNSGSLLYELAVPVGPSATSEHGFPTALGQTIGLGLETPTPDASAEVEAPDPDLDVSGRNDPTSRPRSRERNRRRAPEPPQRPKQPTLDRWATIGTGTP